MTSHVCKCLATNNWEVQQCSLFSTQDDNHWNYLARYPQSSACRFPTCCPCFIRLPIWAVSFNPHMFFLRVPRCFGTQNRCYWMLLTHQNQRKYINSFEFHVYMYTEISWNRCTPNSSISKGFSIVNHPAMGVHPFMENPIPGKATPPSPPRCVWRALYQLRLPWALPSSERMMNLMRRWWMMIACWVHKYNGYCICYDMLWYCGWLQNPAPVDRWLIPLFFRVSTILLVVQDFFHPSYDGIWNQH